MTGSDVVDADGVVRSAVMSWVETAARDTLIKYPHIRPSPWVQFYGGALKIDQHWQAPLIIRYRTISLRERRERERENADSQPCFRCCCCCLFACFHNVFLRYPCTHRYYNFNFSSSSSFLIFFFFHFVLCTVNSEMVDVEPTQDFMQISNRLKSCRCRNLSITNCGAQATAVYRWHGNRLIVPVSRFNCTRSQQSAFCYVDSVQPCCCLWQRGGETAWDED